MRRFFKSTGFKLCVVIVAALVAGSILSAAVRTSSTPVNAVFSAIIAPLQSAASSLADRLSFFSFSFQSSSALAKEIGELEAYIMELQEQLVDYEKLKQDIELYQEFLGLKEENPDFELLEAAVIGRDPTNGFSTFTLNKGTMHDIAVNDPVIYGNALVGVVSSVALTQCTVQTIMNPDINVSAYELRTKDIGYVTTTAELRDNNMLMMPGLENNTAISPGGMVCTSGVGGIYPRGLNIGTVQQVLDDSASISAYALISPAVTMSEIRDVFVITSFAGQAVQEDTP